MGLTAADDSVCTVAAVTAVAASAAVAAVVEEDAMGEGVVAPLQALIRSARPVISNTRSDLLGIVLSPFRLPNGYGFMWRESAT